MQSLVHADTKAMKRGIFQQKKSKKKPNRGQISFGFQLQTFLWHGNTKKFQFKTWKTDKKLISIIEAAISIN